MSSQKGNASRTRGQKHQNSVAYRNDKYGASAQVKLANAKIHDGLCEHCKSILEWKVKYNKYKPLTTAKKCVKCSQKSVKDAYHIICKACSLQLDICCKCGKKEEIVVQIKTDQDREEPLKEDQKKCKSKCKKDKNGLDDDDDDDEEEEDDDLEDFSEDDDDVQKLHPVNGPKISAACLNVSGLDIKS